jgi:hypothetical protein
MAAERTSAAVVTALAPLCVVRFQHAPDAAANLGELKKADSWGQGEFVEKGGWMTEPGSNAPAQPSAVARACAALLAGT